MQVYNNHSLKEYNSFGIDVSAEKLVVFHDSGEIVEFVNENDLSGANYLILGEGSNVLFTADVSGTVLKVGGRGIDIGHEDDEKVLVSAEAGENWDEFVSYCVNKGWGGLENLSLIPGNVGSSPIQNIGAYGVELKDYFHELYALNVFTGEVLAFANKDCKFGYRTSIFKGSARGMFIVISVSFILDKKPKPIISYKGVTEELADMGVEVPGIADLRQAIINIRSRKLPDPAVTGNAGSFFKNPTILRKRYERLLNVYPGMPGFLVDDKNVKVPAAWLIEQCGWKGKKVGNVGVHENQPLVLVNLGDATGREVLDLSKEIHQSVIEKFGIELEREVTVI